MQLRWCRRPVFMRNDKLPGFLTEEATRNVLQCSEDENTWNDIKVVEEFHYVNKDGEHDVVIGKAGTLRKFKRKLANDRKQESLPEQRDEKIPVPPRKRNAAPARPVTEI